MEDESGLTQRLKVEQQKILNSAATRVQQDVGDLRKTTGEGRVGRIIRTALEATKPPQSTVQKENQNPPIKNNKKVPLDRITYGSGRLTPAQKLKEQLDEYGRSR
jgi:hypothetical protein